MSIKFGASIILLLCGAYAYHLYLSQPTGNISSTISATPPQPLLPVQVPPTTSTTQPNTPISTKVPAIESTQQENIGAEGYGPKITAALNTGSPSNALTAAQQIQRCEGIAKEVADVYKLGQNNGFGGDSKGYVAVVEYVEAESRRCQTVAGDLVDLRRKLFFKAINGEVVGAAMLYFAEESRAGRKLEPEVRDFVVDAVRRDAKRGDFDSIALLSAPSTELGVSDTESQIYQTAYRAIASTQSKSESTSSKLVTTLLDTLSSSFKSPSENETSEIKRQAGLVVAAHQKRSIEKAKMKS